MLKAPGELLHKSRMAVFPHHTRANECGQLAGHADSRVVPGTLQDHRAFPCNGILQTSPTFMGLRSGAPFGSGCAIRAQVSHRGRLVGALPQSDRGRGARHLLRIGFRGMVPSVYAGREFGFAMGSPRSPILGSYGESNSTMAANLRRSSSEDFLVLT